MMIKTPLSTVIGGAFWTPSATILGSASKTLNQIIKSLFASGEQGFAYDPNDLTTMFQDAAGTVPITGAGQPVGLIKDKSGRNNDAYQTVSASRPILRQNAVTGAYYLEFDGTDDFLQTNNIDFTATDKVSVFAGVRKLSDMNTAVVAELSTTSDNGKAFTLFAPALLGKAKFLFRSVGSIADLSGGAFTTDTKYSAPFTAVAVGRAKISMDYMSLKLNGALVGDAITDQGTGNYGNYPLYIGRRAGSSNPFNGHIYGLIGIGKLTTDSETTIIEKELAKLTGVTLNV